MKRYSIKKNNRQKGLVLMEAIVALALIGFIAAGFLGAVGTSYKSTSLAMEMTTAESLARSQMEYIKKQDFIAIGEPFVYDVIEHPASYSINWTVGYVAGNITDNRIQKITVTVTHKGETALVLEGYNVKR